MFLKLWLDVEHLPLNHFFAFAVNFKLTFAIATTSDILYCTGYMTQRSQFILTISAVFIFIIALILDITYFGQDWKISWKSIELVRIILILTIIAAIGSFLVCFYFGVDSLGNESCLLFRLRSYFFLCLTFQTPRSATMDLTKSTIISQQGGILKTVKYKFLRQA